VAAGKRRRPISEIFEEPAAGDMLADMVLHDESETEAGQSGLSDHRSVVAGKPALHSQTQFAAALSAISPTCGLPFAPQQGTQTPNIKRNSAAGMPCSGRQ
jgi:hypothetical protein